MAIVFSTGANRGGGAASVRPGRRWRNWAWRRRRSVSSSEPASSAPPAVSPASIHGAGWASWPSTGVARLAPAGTVPLVWGGAAPAGSPVEADGDPEPAPSGAALAAGVAEGVTAADGEPCWAGSGVASGRSPRSPGLTGRAAVEAAAPGSVVEVPTSGGVPGV